MNWDNLMSGFIGALIGGVASVTGAYFSINHNLKLQKKAALEQEEKNEKLSASVLHNDMVGLFRAMTFYANNESKQNLSLGSYNARYSEHIAILDKRLNPDEQYALHQIYGIILKFHNIQLAETSNFSELAKYEMSLSTIFEYFCSLVYGDVATFKKYVANLSVENYQLQLAKRGMINFFSTALDTLIKIKS